MEPNQNPQNSQDPQNPQNQQPAAEQHTAEPNTADPSTTLGSQTGPVGPASAPSAGAAQPQQPLEAVPTVWPGAFGVYKHSKEAVKFVLRPFILYTVVTFVVSLIPSLAKQGTMAHSLIQLLLGLVGVWISAAGIFVLLSGVHREQTTFNHALQKAGKKYLSFLALSLLLGLIAIGTILLLIVPFFLIYPRLAFSQYYLLDKDMGVIDSLKASWDETRGHLGKIYGVIGATILMALLAVTIIGIPFAIYFIIMYSAAPVILYYFIHRNTAAIAVTGPVSSPPSDPSGPILTQK